MKPYEKAQTIRLDENLDRRVRLTQKQKEEIRKLYDGGNTSQGKLARMYGVSRSLIQLVVNPERAKAVSDRFKSHWKEYYMKRGKQYHAEKARNTKNYKYRLFKAGLIKESR